MAHHRVYLPDSIPQTGSIIEITGDEAHHAVRVKRLGIDAQLELLTGWGVRASGTIREIVKVPTRHGKADWVVRLLIERVVKEPQIRPSLAVHASVPKGPRLDDMIDQLSQVGAASWSPLVCARTVVTPRTGKMLKAERTAAEAAKQCGRAWTMTIGEPVSFADALARTHPGCVRDSRLVLADASGEPFEAGPSDDITLLIGPEGGFSETEIEAAREAGASVCRFGPLVLRVETAAVVGAGVILDRQQRPSEP